MYNPNAGTPVLMWDANANAFKHFSVNQVLVPAKEEDKQHDRYLAVAGENAFYNKHKIINFPSALVASNQRHKGILGYYSTRDGRVCALAELKYLNFNCEWDIDNEYEIPKPVYETHGEINPEQSCPNYLWYPPDGWSLLFLHEGAAASLYFYNNENKALRLLPLPNQYENGKICMGQDLSDFITFEPDTDSLFKYGGNSCSHVLECIIDGFMTATWNPDLFSESDQAKFANIFKWKDGKQIPLPGGGDLYDFIIDNTYRVGPPEHLLEFIERYAS